MQALLLFDLDGTLLLAGGAGRRAIGRLFEERYGLAGAMEGIDPAGLTDPQIFREVMAKKLARAPKNGEFARLMSVYPRYLRPEVEKSRGFRVMRGIRELLARLAAIRGVYLALGTGNVELGARIKLRRARLNRFFPVGGFATDAVERGPLIRIAAAKAARYYGRRFRKSEVFVIGDTARDVAAGRVCGFQTVAVDLSLGKTKEILAAKPDFYFTGYSQRHEWIEKLGLR
ncbi:MAG: HAD hydrolase-like protein [Elusimicrobiota bacterium]